MEPTKSFIFPADELAYLLTGLPGPKCPPIRALADHPFQAAEAEAGLLAKGVLRREGEVLSLSGVVRFVLLAAAGAARWARLETPPCLLLRDPRLVIRITPFPRCPGAWRLTPCPDLLSACDGLPPPRGTLRLTWEDGGARALPAPAGPLYDWLVEQKWT